MKKYILTLAAVTATLSATAFGLTDRQRPAGLPVKNMDMTELPAPMVSPRFNAPAEAGDNEEATTSEVLYTLSGEPYNAIGFNNAKAGNQVAMAMQIEPNFVNDMAGNDISSIIFYTGIDNNSNTSSIPKATVFITYDLMGEFLYTQETECPNTPATEVKVDLETPFKIEAGKKIYVGVYFVLTGSNNSPVCIDYMVHDTDFGGWVAIRQGSKFDWTWENITSGYGFVCLGAMISGTNFPTDRVGITTIDGVPVSYQNQEFEVDMLVKNEGANDVNNITVEYGIEGETPVTQTMQFAEPLPFNQSGVIRMTDIKALSAYKSVNVNVKVTQINGVANQSENLAASFPVTIVPTGKGYERNVVIEEFTSTSCTFCPVGYTGMEYVHENYPDGGLIPVCVHVNSPGRDPMTATSFNNVYYNYCTDGVPSGIMNRTFDVYPTVDNLVALYDNVKTLPAIAEVKANATFDPNTRKLTVNTKTAFSFDYTDGNDNFALSYGITENNVGPYTQQNGYSGRQGDYYGWQNEPSTVKLVYNDVARQLDSYSGVRNSVPAEITSGSEYDFTREITLLQSISNVNDINLVVYLLNKNTGAIENATTVKTKDIIGLSGIEDVITDTTDNSAPVEYFNLQGVRVANPAGGIFIRRQGDKVTKVLIK